MEDETHVFIFDSSPMPPFPLVRGISGTEPSLIVVALCVTYHQPSDCHPGKNCMIIHVVLTAESVPMMSSLLLITLNLYLS